MQLILRVFREFEQNFPETMERAVVINGIYVWIISKVHKFAKHVHF